MGKQIVVCFVFLLGKCHPDGNLSEQPKIKASLAEKKSDVPSSISGGKPPTNTFLENFSPLSEPCECGEERAGDPICSPSP